MEALVHLWGFGVARRGRRRAVLRGDSGSGRRKNVGNLVGSNARRTRRLGLPVADWLARTLYARVLSLVLADAGSISCSQSLHFIQTV